MNKLITIISILLISGVAFGFTAKINVKVAPEILGSACIFTDLYKAGQYQCAPKYITFPDKPQASIKASYQMANPHTLKFFILAAGLNHMPIKTTADASCTKIGSLTKAWPTIGLEGELPRADLKDSVTINATIKFDKSDGGSAIISDCSVSKNE